jgi:hypothetical protein
MAKALTREKMYLGQLIVRGEHLEAQVYTIGARQGLNVFLVWFEGSRKCSQWVDYYASYEPTLKQIERSIMVNGRLANSKDITGLLSELTELVV